MKITKVKYERLFPCGSYLNEKIGFEADVSIGFNLETQTRESIESPEFVINQLRQLAENIHKEKYPQYYQPNDEYNVNGVPNIAVGEPLSVLIEKKDPKEMQIQLHIESINTYTDPERLKKNYAPLVEKTPELKEAYNNKLKSFQQ